MTRDPARPGSADYDHASLEAEPNTAMTTGQYAAWLARGAEPIPEDGVPFSDERVRQYCADEGMPGVVKRGKKWVITEPEKAKEWLKAHGAGLRHHGGRSPTASSASAGSSMGTGSGSGNIKERLITEQTRKLAIDNERTIGTLVKASEVEAAIATGVSALRQHLEGIEHDMVSIVAARVPDLSPEQRRLIERDMREHVERTVGAVLRDTLGHELDDEIAKIASGGDT